MARGTAIRELRQMAEAVELEVNEHAGGGGQRMPTIYWFYERKYAAQNDLVFTAYGRREAIFWLMGYSTAKARA